MADVQQSRPLTADEQFKMLFERTAKLSDRVSALMSPEWGARTGLLPRVHPLHPDAHRGAEPTEICIWCFDHRPIPSSEFDEHLNREHPELSDPRNSTSCWSRAEVCTPDGAIQEIACGRGRHRWGKHHNRHARWTCPPRCGCVRHSKRTKEKADG